MHRLLSRFSRDNRGALSERWAIIAGSIGIVCVVGTHLIDAGLRNGTIPTVLVRRGGLPTPPQTSAVQSADPVRQTAAGIDYDPTASIPSVAAATRLDPCTSPAKP